jgi:hypothetical protein
MKQLRRKQIRLLLLIALPPFLVFFISTARTLSRAVWGDEVDSIMVGTAPFAWDCGTTDTDNNIKQDSCALLATKMHIPFRVRYNRGDMQGHGRYIRAVVMNLTGNRIIIHAEQSFEVENIRQENY